MCVCVCVCGRGGAIFLRPRYPPLGHTAEECTRYAHGQIIRCMCGKWSGKKSGAARVQTVDDAKHVVFDIP